MDPVKVSITGAAGQIAYSLIPLVARGEVFGLEQSLILTLLDIEPMMGVLEGVKMEIMDCAYPLVTDVICTCDPDEAFKDVDAVFLVGAMPRKEGMERKHLLAANVKIFKEQGIALEKVGKATTKVLVVGNPANTNALICSKYAPKISARNFTCLTRLDQNRAQAQIASLTGVPVKDVKQVIIWGNHSSTQYPDVRFAKVVKDGKEIPVKDAAKGAAKDENFLKTEFIKTVQQRGAAVIKARKLSSALSAAKASADHMRDWWCGTEGRWVSMGVISEGDYDIQKGLMYSFPVTIDDKKNWKVVKGLDIDDFSREKMNATAKELAEEKAAAEDVTK